MADVLAQVALDTLAELLDPIYVGLRHPPGPVGSIRRARLEALDLLLDLIVPRYVGGEISDLWKRFHRLDGHRLVQRQLIQSGHTHQLWHPVDFGRAGSTSS